MMEINQDYHRLLKRQLKKYLANGNILSTDLMEFINSVDEAYKQHDIDYQQLDRTLEVSTEELFRANLETSKVNEELDRFIYSASHDIKAPLTSIEGLVRLVRPTVSIEGKLYLDHLDKAIHRLKSVVTVLSNFTKNARMDSSIEELNVKNCISEALENICHKEKLDEMGIDFSILGSSEASIVTDKNRLLNLLQNLLHNSITYTDFEKKIRKIQVSFLIENGVCTIRVEDNGVGIHEEQMDKVFNMFYRGNFKSQGAGLGLYISKDIIRRLKGKIQLNSRPNEGTTVEFQIPNLSPSNDHSNNDNHLKSMTA
jgi:signal transduction histidine kinase